MAIQKVISRLKPLWHLNHLESIDNVEMAETKLGCPLPADYKYLLMELGPGESDLPGGYLRVYPLEELPRRQESGLPSIVVFGSDGGDHGFGFDAGSRRESASYRVVEFPTSAIDRSEVEIAGDSLELFLKKRLGT